MCVGEVGAGEVEWGEPSFLSRSKFLFHQEQPWNIFQKSKQKVTKFASF